MSYVNPELDGVGGDRVVAQAGIEALFGTDAPAVMRAVQRFFSRGPSAFDEANLRFAAALPAPHLDPAQIASVIDALPVTKQALALARPDLERLRPQLQKVLGCYRRAERAAILSDLIDSATTTTFDASSVRTVSSRASPTWPTIAVAGTMQRSNAIPLMSAPRSPRVRTRGRGRQRS